MARVPVLFLQSQNFFGADTHMHSLLMQHLDRERFDVHVAVDANGSDEVAGQISQIPGVKVIRINFGPSVFKQSRSEILRNLWGGLPAIVDLPKLAIYMRRHGIRIVHGTEKPRDALYGVVLAKATGARSIVHLHVKMHEALTGRALWAMQHADAVVGVSGWVAETAAARGISRDRLYAVPNAMAVNGWTPDPEGARRVREEFGIPDGAPVLAVSARLFLWKGHRELIEAVARIAPSWPELRLLIVGEDDPRAHPGGGSFKAELQELAKSLGVSENVIFAGFRRDIRQILSASDIYTMPSFEEPWGVAFMEAMAMEKPVVALRSGGTPELVLDGVTGLLSEPGDIERLAANIGSLLADPELRARMGAAGRERMCSTFTPRHMAENIGEVYQQVLAR
ncbi:MAG: glycosyltransferase family 4 protein [Hyphomicrobiales bacterium]